MSRRRVNVLVVLLIVATTVALILGGIGRIRQAAAAMNCSNNLKQFGMGIHNHHDTYGRLPQLVDQGEGSPTGCGLPSVWHNLIPFIESTTILYRGDSPPPAKYHAHSSMPFNFVWKGGDPGTQHGGDANRIWSRPFLDPADATASKLRDVPMTLPDGSTGYYATGSYAANGMMPWGVRRPRMNLSENLGSAILFAERPQVCRTAAGEDVYNLWGVGFYSPHMPAFATLTPTDQPGLWSTGQIAPVTRQPNLVRIGRQDAIPEPPDFDTPLQFIRPGRACDPRLPGTLHRGGMQAAMGDGSVRVFTPGTDPWVFWAACTPTGWPTPVDGP